MTCDLTWTVNEYLRLLLKDLGLALTCPRLLGISPDNEKQNLRIDL